MCGGGSHGRIDHQFSDVGNLIAQGKAIAVMVHLTTDLSGSGDLLFGIFLGQFQVSYEFVNIPLKLPPRRSCVYALCIGLLHKEGMLSNK